MGVEETAMFRLHEHNKARDHGQPYHAPTPSEWFALRVPAGARIARRPVPKSWRERDRATKERAMSATGQLELRPYETIVLADEAQGQMVTLTLNRPEARNAISRRMAAELADALLELGGRREVRVVIVAGASDRAFCAGADLKERLTLSPDERIAHTAAIEAAAEALAALPMVTIAAVRGYALAGGTELAIACDLRVAATDAVFGLPEVKIGIFPGAGGVLRLPRLVGTGAARDLLFTGRQVAAEEAARLGLIDRLVAPEAVLPAARELAGQVAANAPLAVRAVKRALNESFGLVEAEARRVVNRHRATLDATADYQEGLTAFAERRAPRFRGK
jgi:enoyl-CoA hydratase/carnithine racemase